LGQEPIRSLFVILDGHERMLVREKLVVSAAHVQARCGYEFGSVGDPEGREQGPDLRRLAAEILFGLEESGETKVGLVGDGVVAEPEFFVAWPFGNDVLETSREGEEPFVCPPGKPVFLLVIERKPDRGGHLEEVVPQASDGPERRVLFVPVLQVDDRPFAPWLPRTSARGG